MGRAELGGRVWRAVEGGVRRGPRRAALGGRSARLGGEVVQAPAAAPRAPPARGGTWRRRPGCSPSSPPAGPCRAQTWRARLRGGGRGEGAGVAGEGGAGGAGSGRGRRPKTALAGAQPQDRPAGLTHAQHLQGARVVARRVHQHALAGQPVTPGAEGQAGGAPPRARGPPPGAAASVGRGGARQGHAHPAAPHSACQPPRRHKPSLPAPPVSSALQSPQRPGLPPLTAPPPGSIPPSTSTSRSAPRSARRACRCPCLGGWVRGWVGGWGWGGVGWGCWEGGEGGRGLLCCTGAGARGTGAQPGCPRAQRRSGQGPQSGEGVLTESDGRDDDGDAARLPRVLHLHALLVAHARVVVRRAEAARLPEVPRDALGLVAGEAVDDAARGGPLLAHEGDEAGHAGRLVLAVGRALHLGHDAEDEVGPVEAGLRFFGGEGAGRVRQARAQGWAERGAMLDSGAWRVSRCAGDGTGSRLVPPSPPAPHLEDVRRLDAQQL
jgi:hypothetical protein